jgi:hypothetical protein
MWSKINVQVKIFTHVGQHGQGFVILGFVETINRLKNRPYGYFDSFLLTLEVVYLPKLRLQLEKKFERLRSQNILSNLGSFESCKGA